MTLSADERLPENYTNNYWKADDSFPKPTGLFGKYIEKEKNLATQKEEAEQLRRRQEAELEEAWELLCECLRHGVERGVRRQ